MQSLGVRGPSPGYLVHTHARTLNCFQTALRDHALSLVAIQLKKPNRLQQAERRLRSEVLLGMARRKTDARSRWIMSLEQRRGKNIATVAIANKNARIAWTLLTSDAEYRKAA